MEAFGRRSFIRLGSIAAFRWITLGAALEQRALAASRKGDDISVIHLFLTGGMSQMDTFDPKPNAKPEFRSKFQPIATSVPGFKVTEHLPRCAKLAHKYTTIRSMTHKTPVHVPACGLILSGHLPLSSITHPCVGSVVAKEVGPRNELPAFVSVPGSTGYWKEPDTSNRATTRSMQEIRTPKTFVFATWICPSALTGHGWIADARC